MRTDSEQQTAWTPGTWFVPKIQPMPEVYAGPSPRDAVAKCYPQADKTQANAKLIALAPTMAAKLLALDEQLRRDAALYGHPDTTSLDKHGIHALANDLRRIQ